VFNVTVPSGSTFYLDDYLQSFIGSFLFINNGTFVWQSDQYFYTDPASVFLNLGLLSVVPYSTDFILGSTWNASGSGLATSNAFTMINKGNVQFSNGGALNFNAGTGNFYSCSGATLSFVFGSTSPAEGTFPFIALDGYVDVYYVNGATASSSVILFSWVTSFYTTTLNNLFTGNVGESTHGVATPLTLCFDGSNGDATLYTASSLTVPGVCGTGAYQVANVGSACGSLPTALTSLTPSCPRSVSCGYNTGQVTSGSTSGVSSGTTSGASSGTTSTKSTTGTTSGTTSGSSSGTTSGSTTGTRATTSSNPSSTTGASGALFSSAVVILCLLCAFVLF